MHNFHLIYKNIIIGYLSYDDASDKWIFKYDTKNFISSTLTVLANFQTLFKTYESTDLFPFFKGRLPYHKQKEGETDLDLLISYGEKCVNNPSIVKYIK